MDVSSVASTQSFTFTSVQVFAQVEVSSSSASAAPATGAGAPAKKNDDGAPTHTRHGHHGAYGIVQNVFLALSQIGITIEGRSGTPSSSSAPSAKADDSDGGSGFDISHAVRSFVRDLLDALRGGGQITPRASTDSEATAAPSVDSTASATGATNATSASTAAANPPAPAVSAPTNTQNPVPASSTNADVTDATSNTVGGALSTSSSSKASAASGVWQAFHTFLHDLFAVLRANSPGSDTDGRSASTHRHGYSTFVSNLQDLVASFNAGGSDATRSPALQKLETDFQKLVLAAGKSSTGGQASGGATPTLQSFLTHLLQNVTGQTQQQPTSAANPVGGLLNATA